MDIILFLAGLLAGAGLVFALMLMRGNRRIKEIEAANIQSEKQAGILEDRYQQLTSQLKQAQEQLESERTKSTGLNASLAEQKAINESFKEKLESQKRELEEIHQRLTVEFENLSSKLLEEKSKKFAEQNRSNLDIILNPLKEKISEFEKRVEDSYKTESAERNTLKGEIKSLIELNKQMSEDTNNLTRALKGDTRKQGNWGEVILERILERSGLVKGSEYEVQFSTANEEGSRIRPDVIVHLPENKHIIIDSKVSLTAYEALVSAQTEEDRAKFMKEHVASVRSHIRLLSEKEYFTARDLSTPDFVLIFMPLEPAFSFALQGDNELFSYAWEKKIVLVSPSTLFATLKTISSIWKNEKQSRNAFEIAKLGGSLYDKFYGFLKDMDNLGDKIAAAQQSHIDAMKKLSSGPGNIIRRVEAMKKLGATTSKEIPQSHLLNADDDAEN